MNGFRCWVLTFLLLTGATQTAWTYEKPTDQAPRFGAVSGCVTSVPTCAMYEVVGVKVVAQDHTCVIYSLDELGDDPSFGQWIAETIPEVIEPGSWNREGASGKKQVLSYFAPKKMMVVYHTPAVQTKVDAFLKGVKKAMPAQVSAKNQGGVEAQSLEATVGRATSPPPTQVSPVVPSPARQPKHLFHFIIRYEGAGIVDDNVVKLVKILQEQKAGGPACCSPSRWTPGYGVQAPMTSGSSLLVPPACEASDPICPAPGTTLPCLPTPGRVVARDGGDRTYCDGENDRRPGSLFCESGLLWYEGPESVKESASGAA